MMGKTGNLPVLSHHFSRFLRPEVETGYDLSMANFPKMWARRLRNR